MKMSKIIKPTKEDQVTLDRKVYKSFVRELLRRCFVGLLCNGITMTCMILWEMVKDYQKHKRYTGNIMILSELV